MLIKYILFALEKEINYLILLSLLFLSSNDSFGIFLHKIIVATELFNE